EDRALDRPGAGTPRALDQLVQQRSADAVPAEVSRDVHAVLENARVAAPRRRRREGRPAEHLAAGLRDNPKRVAPGPDLPRRHLGLERGEAVTDAVPVDLRDARPIPGPDLPRRHLGLERGEAVTDAVPVDLRDARPIVRAHVADLDSCRGR